MNKEQKSNLIQYVCLLFVIIITGITTRINDDKHFEKTVNFQVITHCQQLSDNSPSLDWDMCIDYYTKLYNEKGDMR